MRNKNFMVLLLMITILVVLSGCRVSFNDFEIKCENDECLTNTKTNSEYNSSNDVSSNSNSSIGNNKDSGDVGTNNPSDVNAGKFNPDEGGGAAGCGSKYNLLSPAKGIFGSFPYYDSEPSSTSNRNSLNMCPSWENKNFTKVSTTCSNGTVYSWRVNVKASSSFKKVQEKFCEFITIGVDGIKYNPNEITISGPTVVRFVSNSKYISLHAYGIAIDVNPDASYTIDGKKYQTPYGRDKEQYNNFVRALGNESDPRNVNYILWKKVFQPLGFRWGGNWGRNGNSGVYDGMHFEIDWRQTKQ